MKLRGISMIALAMALGLAAVVMAQNWLQNRTSQPGPEAKTSKIIVAAMPLEFGARLSREHLKEMPWPSESVPEGTFTSIDELLVKGEERVVLRPLAVNEPIMTDKVTMPGGRATLSTVLAKDKRAITIRVNDVLGVAGFVLPGDRVDVLLTHGQQAQQAASETDILLQNVRVLGIDQETSERRDKPTVARAVTLEVTPDEAQKLTLGSQVGSLSLTLRNHTDQVAVKSRSISLRDLQSMSEVSAAKPGVATVSKTGQKPAGFTIQILRGTETASHTLPSAR